MTQTVVLTGKCFDDAEYALLIDSFMVAEQTAAIPVTEDSKYQVRFTINDIEIEVDFKKVAEYVVGRYASMLDKRAAEIAQELLAGKTRQVEEECQKLQETLAESRQALREYIRNTFSYRLPDDY